MSGFHRLFSRSSSVNKGLEMFDPTNTIQEQNWKEGEGINDDRFLEVIVAEVFSPDYFFIQLKVLMLYLLCQMLTS